MAFECGEIGFENLSSLSFIFVVVSVFFGYANFVLSGYFKDIEADRATGYITLLVKYERKVAAYISDVFAFLMIFFGLMVILHETKRFNMTLFSNPALLFLIASLILTIIGQILLHKVQTDVEAHPAIALVVHSYILQFGGLALLRKPEWLFFLIVFYVGFNVVMKLRPVKNQI
jgi:4-hydroxybenzoate polyprenyltransferase